MSFNSLEFFVLFLCVVILYFGLPHRFRNPLLLTASAVFYMWWRPEYVLIILFSVTVDYFVAFGLERDSRTWHRRLLLVTSLVTNLGLLFFFKYFEFFGDIVHSALGLAGVRWRPPVLNLILPIGISFHTFQALSYTIDVYHGKIPIQRNLFRLWLYVLFFPQLVAGPIERSGNLLPQFSRVHEFDEFRVSSGLRLMLWGLIKKMVIADRLAVFVDTVYNAPTHYAGPPLLAATYAFAVQIYCDFSGYSDIAIGAARVLGFTLMQNFRQPYFSSSIPEFWRRWHISLSTWFRDYLYVPLGGNRKHLYANLLITFLLSGIWHGAKWTFVIWGAYHGVLMMLSVATRRIRERWRGPLGSSGGWTAIRVLITFHLVLLGWVFFRANSVSDALFILSHLLDAPRGKFSHGIGMKAADLSLALGGIALLLVVDLLELRAPLPDRVGRWPVRIRWAAYVAGALLLLNLGAEAEVPFIYFQF